MTFILASKFTRVTKLNLLAKMKALVRRMEMNLFVNATKIGLAQLAKRKVNAINNSQKSSRRNSDSRRLVFLNFTLPF